jgi:hypothetical protein
LGKINSQDSEFEAFEALEFGVRAMYLNLINYYFNLNLNTIEKIILRWSETDVNEYINFVSKYIKISKNEVFKMNKDNLIKLAKAIVLFENGIKIDNSIYELAYQILPKDKKILVESLK